MFFRIAKITLCAIAILTGFAIIGLFTRPLLDAAKVSDSKSDSVIPQNCGAGIAFAMLGGYRTLLADFVWIKGYIDWERQDLSGCVSAIDLATTLDPDSVFYWRFGAGIIAGALWGAIPGLLKATLNINEVITCIMTKSSGIDPKKISSL